MTKIKNIYFILILYISGDLCYIFNRALNFKKVRKKIPVQGGIKNMIEYIGFVAASLTTLSFLPQTIQIIKTRDTKSISLVMYIMFVSGVALWLTYGMYKGDKPLIFANTITLILSSIILVFKLNEVFGKK